MFNYGNKYCDTFVQSCGSRMFISDPNFFHPGSRVKKILRSRIRIRIKEFWGILTQNFFSLNSQKYDPGCTSRILIFLSIPDPGSKRFSDPGSGSESKNLGILTRKIVSKLSEIWSGSWFFTHPGSRGQKGTGSWIQGSKRHQIPDPRVKMAQDTGSKTLLLWQNRPKSHFIDICMAKMSFAASQSRSTLNCKRKSD